MRIVISPGHGLLIRGASYTDPDDGWGLDEVDEARRVVEALAEALRQRRGFEVDVVMDDHSTEQQPNLDFLVAEHNRRERDLDISVHLNAASPTDGMRGTECFFQTQSELAALVSEAISDAAGITDRGAKYGNFFWLSHTNRPAILVEICFVDAREDVEAYEASFDDIIKSLAAVQLLDQPLESKQVEFAGTCSWFGGPQDDGVAWDENLAWWENWDQVEAAGATSLFLSEQPPNTSGLARRLDSDEEHFVACRWDYDVTPKSMLADQRLLASVYAPKTGKRFLARPVDWGPHEEKTGRAADLSKALLQLLAIETDDEVVVTYPVQTRR